ncbi:MAG: protein-glutamate O-methyltransferase CheR [Anaeromyxobacteraceae bacterium]
MFPLEPRGPRLSEDEFRLLREVIQRHCGIHFRDDLVYLLERRLAPRLEVLGLPDFGAYHRYLRFDPNREEELEALVDVLTTNETYFWREPVQLKAFERELIPLLATSLAAERRLRILSAGCSTGEEAYTLATLLRDSGRFAGWEVEVIGVDIARRVVGAAREGAYREHAFRSTDSERMRRWFKLRGGRWIVDDEIRRMVRFEQGNLVDPRGLVGLGRMDAVFCRNVMIYFDLPARQLVLRGFHRALRDGGFLLLGHAESLLNASADFELFHLQDELVYRKPMAAAIGAEDGVTP